MYPIRFPFLSVSGSSSMKKVYIVDAGNLYQRLDYRRSKQHFRCQRHILIAPIKMKIQLGIIQRPVLDAYLFGEHAFIIYGVGLFFRLFSAHL